MPTNRQNTAKSKENAIKGDKLGSSKILQKLQRLEKGLESYFSGSEKVSYYEYHQIRCLARRLGVTIYVGKVGLETIEIEVDKWQH